MSHEVLAIIDAFLTDTKHNSLIDGDRVRDLLLDIRSGLSATTDTIDTPSIQELLT